MIFTSFIGFVNSETLICFFFLGYCFGLPDITLVRYLDMTAVCSISMSMWLLFILTLSQYASLVSTLMLDPVGSKNECMEIYFACGSGTFAVAIYY